MTSEAMAQAAQIAEVIRSRAVHPVFQPVFDLATTEIVGFEALARGPHGSAMESPRALFGAARQHGYTAELDWVCRAAAFETFLDSDAPPALTLLINAEPESLGVECPDDLLPVVHKAESSLRVMVEVNDRALAEDPAQLLAVERRAREMGWGIVLDDVGSGPGANAMIPVMRPDMVKIDLALLRAVSDASAAAVILAATRHAERTGASLCVESIENEEDVHFARALGAAYGQGHHLGAPGPLPHNLRAPRKPIPLVAPSDGDVAGRTPWDLVDHVETRRVDPDHFVEWARVIARGSIAPGAAPIILAGVGRDGFDGDVAATFPQQDVPLLSAAFGVGIEEEPLPGLRGVRLTADDPLASVPFLVVISPAGGFALLGRGEPDGKILALVTQDNATVDDIARHLMRRIPRVGGNGMALEPTAPIARDPQESSHEHPDEGAGGGRRLFARRER